jgi:rod shape determining protein RodA
LGVFILAGALGSVANFGYNALPRHQQERILVWLKPSEADPQGAAYNLNHSKMAIASGGITGKGFLEGSFTQGNFVPEQTTDFIFCAVGEEQGFIGVIFIISLYLGLMIRIVVVAERQRSDFNRLYAYGVASVLFVHFFINIGMTMGLMPIIGIPLPFLSKGGSSLIAFSMMIGVLLKLESEKS